MASRKLVTRERRFIYVPNDIETDTPVVIRATARVRGTGVRVRAGSVAQNSQDEAFTVRRVLRPLQVPTLSITGPDRLLENTGIGLFSAYTVPEFTTSGIGTGAKIRRITVDSEGAIRSIDWLLRGTCHTPGDTFTFTQPGGGSGIYVLRANDVDEIGALNTFNQVDIGNGFRSDVIGGDYDNISYRWSIVSGGGSFNTVFGRTVQYTPPAVSVNTSVTLRCTITVNGTGASGVRGRITAETRSFTRDFDIIVTDHIDAAVPTLRITPIDSISVDDSETATLVVSVVGGGAYDSIDSYVWSVVDGGGTIVGNGAQAVYTPPPEGGEIGVQCIVTVSGNGINADRGTTDSVTLAEGFPANKSPFWTDPTGDEITDSGVIDVPAALGYPAPTYAVVGSLPTGFSFNPATRELTVFPMQIGTGTITIRATNIAGSADWTVAYSLAPSPPVFSVDTGDAIDGVFGQVLTPIQVPIASGVPAPTYSVVGSLPPGLSFSPTTRVISGTPTEGGQGTIIIRATNLAGTDDWTADYTIRRAPFFAVPIGTDFIASAQEAITPIQVPIAAGFPVPTYSVDPASFPAGLNFNSRTRIISGTPTTQGSGTIRVTASNSLGSASWTVRYTISSATRVTAEAGPNQRVDAGDVVTLAAVATVVRGVGPTTYAWDQLVGLDVTLSDAAIAGPTFTVPEVVEGLLMTGVRTDRLYRLDPATGVATRVGSASRFGVSEGTPTALAYHLGTLYMLGSQQDALFTVGLTTGVATRVGSASRFGLGLNSPSALASHNTRLYMISDERFFVLNTTTGVATQIGISNRFGVSSQGSSSLASHGGRLFMITNSALYTVDPETGLATRVGSANNFGVGSVTATGMASIGNQLYMSDNSQGGRLFTVDPNTGVATRVGSTAGFGVGESLPTGLTTILDNLFRFQVTVTNNDVSDSDSVDIIIPVTRIFGDAIDQEVNQGATVTLDVNPTIIDAEGATTYAWRQVGGVEVTLSDANVKSPTFTAPLGDHTLSFEVTITNNEVDGIVITNVVVVNDTVVEVTFANTDMNQVVPWRHNFTIELTASAQVTNPHGDTTYAWEQISGMSGSFSDLAAAQTVYTVPDARPLPYQTFDVTIRVTATNNGKTGTATMSFPVSDTFFSGINNAITNNAGFFLDIGGSVALSPGSDLARLFRIDNPLGTTTYEVAGVNLPSGFSVSDVIRDGENLTRRDARFLLESNRATSPSQGQEIVISLNITGTNNGVSATALWRVVITYRA